MTRATDPAAAAATPSAEDASFGLAALRQMAFIRAFETQVLELSKATPAAIVGSVHLCAGQEAAPVGALAALREDDRVIATYRGHGWALASGLAPRELLAELCHREAGLNGGRAGSAYFMAPERRFIGENSIVGAGVPIACGVAMAEVAAGSGRVVIVSIGDGAMNQGSVHEGLVFAAARQLPVILLVENNGWSELTPTHEIVRIERLSERARGYGITGATVDGTDPFAVRGVVRMAAERARAGKGPQLIECRLPRLWGHYNRDIEHYRPREDKARAAAADPIPLLARRLAEARVLDAAQVEALIAAENERMAALAREVLGLSAPNPTTALDHVQQAADQASPAATTPPAGTEVREMSYIGAVNAALRAELASDPRTRVYGEDCGRSGGVFGATRDLQKQFGEDRVFDTPIAESAILGSAVGSALCGLKPIVEIMWSDFMLVALDQLVNQAANVRYITRGKSSVPLVVRMQQGATAGSCAQHSQCLEALLAHVPGLKVALSATPQDAYDLLRAAAADPDPCIVIEARGLYQSVAPVTLHEQPEPVGRARLRREGRDLAIVTWGTMVSRAIDAAARLAEEGIDAAVLDLRWLAPMDEEQLRSVVRAAGGKALVVHEAVVRGGYGAEVVARLHELTGLHVPIQVRRLATPNVRMPASPVLQAALLPDAASIADAARALLHPPI